MAEEIIDFAYDDGFETFEEAVRIFGAEHGVGVEVLRRVGPTAGWPEIRITGPRDNVTSAIRANDHF